MADEPVIVDRDDEGVVTVTMNRPSRRNALSFPVLTDLRDRLVAIGESDARGVLLRAEGPVFSAGHDYADLADADLAGMRRLLRRCTEAMDAIQSIPQVVLAEVAGLATAAGCQLVASCDLAVAAESAAFAAPGGKGGWFCTTPLVAIARNLPRKRAFELAATGDAVDATTAADWGLVNRVVPDDEVHAAALDLLRRATRGSRSSKGIGKHAFYAQIELPQPQAYDLAVEVMASASQIPDAREGVAAFLEKRRPSF